MVSALTRVFGIHNLALAEDVVQDALCRALTVWKLRGMPDNPSAWLMATAKNRALDVLRRERTARTFAPELARMLDSEWTLAPATLESVRAAPIEDDQLRMMFSCCHPRLPEEAQLALVLHILCGFSVGEVASALARRRGRDREAHLAREEGAGRIASGCSSWRTRTRPAACRRCSARCTCCSTRVTTARIPAAAVRGELCRTRCGSRRCCAATR